MRCMLRRWIPGADRTCGHDRAEPAHILGCLLFCLQVVIAVVACSPAGQSLPVQLEKERTVTVNNTERTYRLFVPPSNKPNVPSPLVFVFHGGGMTSEMMADGTQFYLVAEKHNFIVVFPQGIKKLWYNIVPVEFANDKSIDDMAFVRAMLKQIQSEYSIDPKRIYATGVSLGGILSYKLACQMSDTFAAVAPVSASMTTTDCDPKSPVAVLHIHAKDDQNIPFTGGRGRHTARGNSFPPVTDGLEFWRKENGCQEKHDEISKAAESECWAYTGCTSKKPVDLCMVEGGHQWPGQYKRALFQILAGVEVAKSFPASEKIWDFFEANPK